MLIFGGGWLYFFVLNLSGWSWSYFFVFNLSCWGCWFFCALFFSLVHALQPFIFICVIAATCIPSKCNSWVIFFIIKSWSGWTLLRMIAHSWKKEGCMYYCHADVRGDHSSPRLGLFLCHMCSQCLGSFPHFLPTSFFSHMLAIPSFLDFDSTKTWTRYAKFTGQAFFSGHWKDTKYQWHVFFHFV